jgi:hypothetical protein
MPVCGWLELEVTTEGKSTVLLWNFVYRYSTLRPHNGDIWRSYPAKCARWYAS